MIYSIQPEYTTRMNDLYISLIRILQETFPPTKNRSFPLMKEDCEGIRKLVLEYSNIQDLVTEVTLREQTSISDFISHIYAPTSLTVFQSRDKNTQERSKATQCTKKRLKSLETFLKRYKVTSTEVNSFNVNICLRFWIFCRKVKEPIRNSLRTLLVFSI